jgi:uncharacterized membrane protein HdeD (DUF308 family)
VLLFSVYAILDGAWTISAGTRTSTRAFDAWPLLLEGAVSVGLGLVALAWPFVPRQFVYVLAAWGLITGVLELVAAIRLPRSAAGHWLLGTAGVSSLFLAALLLVLPHADDDLIMRVMAAYALAFGTVLLLAAIFFPRRGALPRAHRPPPRCEPLTRSYRGASAGLARHVSARTLDAGARLRVPPLRVLRRRHASLDSARHVRLQQRRIAPDRRRRAPLASLGLG